MKWKVNPSYLPDGVDPDDYRFSDRKLYEAFLEAVAVGEYSGTVQGWIAFVDADRVLGDKAWPEVVFEDILDAEYIDD